MDYKTNYSYSEDIIANSSDMKSLVNIIDKVATTNINVLIVGESGSGKEFFAREIHKKGSKENSPFVVVNCSSLTNNTFESNFFGQVAGNGNEEITGIVEKANEGTIYLNEITNLTKDLQEKILTFAEKGEFTKLGSSEAKRVNLRIIASTTKRLENEVRNGSLKNDFFYRLNAIILRVPSLRKRKEDITDLIKLFMSPTINNITEDAMQTLTEHTWPGNVRELINIIEKIKIFLPYNDKTGERTITKESLPPEISEFTKYYKNQNHPRKLEDIEREHILSALNYFNGNKSKTATALGVTLKTLYNKLNRYREENLY